MNASQTANAQGTGNVIIQIIGDHNTVVRGQAYLSLKTAQTYLPPPKKDYALAKLNPWRASIPLIGREPELVSLRAWLDSPEPISIRVITGRGGTGKTRLALELCREFGQKPGREAWKGGFVTSSEAKRFFEQQNLTDWGWQSPVLAVFDDALACAGLLKKWLGELVNNPGRQGCPLRILLLEREASVSDGWLHRLMPDGHGQCDVSGLFDESEPIMKLLPLISTEDRRAVLTAAMEAFECREALPASGTDPLFEERLASLDWAGDPLYLMMTAYVARDKGLVTALSLSRADAALHIAGVELERIGRLAGDNENRQVVLKHMAAYVTLCMGLGAKALREAIKVEKEAIGRAEDCAAGEMACLLIEAAPAKGGGMRAIQPDLIGEAVLLKALGDGDSDMAQEAVLRVFAKKPPVVVSALMRCAQDLGDAVTPKRPDGTYDPAKPPLLWLMALADKDGLSLDEHRLLANSLPQSSTFLAPFAVQVTHSLCERLRRLPTDTETTARLAGYLSNLAVRLEEAGGREEALEKAHESVNIWRELTSRNRDAYLPDFAKSLNTLSVMLNYAGRREKALEIAQESVDIWRELTMRNRDAYLRDLAMSLNTLAGSLSEAGRRKEALKKAQESAGYYGELAMRNRDTYLPDLAKSLNNLAISLSQSGRHGEALKNAQNSADYYGELVARNRDAYLPKRASSLDTLANCFSEVGRHEDALKEAQEAVGYFDELASRNRDAYLPGWAISLTTLASCLSNAGRREDALKEAQEAVGYFSELASRNRDANLPDQAKSLHNLAIMLRLDGKHEVALEKAKEAVTIRRELAEKLSAVYTPLLAESLLSMARILGEFHREEDAEAAVKEARELLGEGAFKALFKKSS